MSNIIQTKNLQIGYGKSVLVEDINLTFDSGEIVSLIGPNGSGKSTLLKTITNQLEKMGGSIAVKEKELSDISSGEIGKTMSLLLTDKIRPEMMSAFEVVCTGRYPYTGMMGILSEEDKEIAWAAVARMQIEDLADKDYMQLSDGQKQRVMLARAICQDTEILILDEPTTYLDINYKLSLMQMVQDLAREKNKLVIMSIHELDLAKIYSDRIVCVSGDHRLDRVATAEEIFSGDYIDTLFGMQPGTYRDLLGRI